MNLRNKKIIVVSPQKWGLPFVSKHHYTLELLHHGAKVYFFEPIDRSLGRGKINSIEPKDYAGLTIISYNPCFPYNLKFHAYWMFKKLMNIQWKKIIRSLDLRDVELMIDFDNSGNVYDHGIFNAKTSIFFPVDVLPPFARTDRNATFIYSISNKILNTISTSKEKRLIGHGLNKCFAMKSKQLLSLLEKGEWLYKKPKKITVGMAGNLNIHSLDTSIIQCIVNWFPNIDFHFYGNCELVDTGTNNYDLISFLASCSNVILHGLVQTDKLADLLFDHDVLWLSYKSSPSYSMDNSHKILEYLSTGKVIISSYLSHYKMNNLLEMSEAGNDEQMIKKFEVIVANLASYNNTDRMIKRIKYALKRTYPSRLNDILQNAK